MSPQKGRPQKRRPPPRKGTAVAANKGRTAVAARKGRRRNDRTAWIAAGVVVVVGLSLVAAFASSASKTRGATQADKPAPAGLVAKVTGVPADVIAQVGRGGVPLPKKLPGPLLTEGGKPRIVYIGAEYCPFCAAERWAMVNALSRFGTFENLQTTTSAGPPESFPNTSTFSFYKSTYTSNYIHFEPIETQTNQREPLETPTTEQAALLAKWDKPPYETQAGAIPFIDFADTYLVVGASYDPGVLANKTWDEIAAAMQDPSSDIAKGAVGTANAMTAAICGLTNDKPANVCSNAEIQKIEADLKTAS